MILVAVKLTREINTSATLVRKVNASAILTKTAHLDMSKIAMTPDDGVHEIIAGALDDSNDTFTLPHPYSTKRLLLFYNGIQEREFTELDPSAGTFQMNFVPASDGKLTALYT